MGHHLATFRRLCNSKLQLNAVVVQESRICNAKMARQQLRCLQGYLGAMLGRDRVTVQPRSALEVGDLANAMGKSLESPQPVVEIEGRAPLLSKPSY